MAGTLTRKGEGEGKVQTTNRVGSESCSGTHNPKVAGSNPAPATNFLVLRSKGMFESGLLNFGIGMLVGAGTVALAFLISRRGQESKQKSDSRSFPEPSRIRSSRSILEGTGSRERIMKYSSRARFR